MYMKLQKGGMSPLKKNPNTGVHKSQKFKEPHYERVQWDQWVSQEL